MLPLQERVNLGVMAMKEYSEFPKATTITIRLFSVISRTLVVGILLFCRDVVSALFSPSRLGKWIAQQDIRRNGYRHLVEKCICDIIWRSKVQSQLKVNNKEYLQLYTCIRSWLREQSTPVVHFEAVCWIQSSMSQTWRRLKDSLVKTLWL